MPRYYFHVRDGVSRLQDEEGMVLPDAEAAWYQALRSARELIRHDPFHNGFKPGRAMEIADENGWKVAALPFEEVLPVVA